MTDRLVDLLCARLAVEEAVVRIYDALRGKVQDPEIDKKLARFERQEVQHRDLLATWLDRIGVPQPMRQTPEARVARLEGESYLRLIDEIESPLHLLSILLTVELTDETGWELLIDLARDLGDREVLEAFEPCLDNEKDHLRQVRGMVAELSRVEMRRHTVM